MSQFEVVYNKALKIFSQLYVGVKPAEYHARVWQIGTDSWNSAEHIHGQALMLPRFDTIDELKTYLHKLHLDKKLVHQRCKENT